MIRRVSLCLLASIWPAIAYAQPAAPDPLSELRDIQLPPEPSAWPPAIGWWLVAAAMLAALVFIVMRLRARRKAQLRRRTRLAALEACWQQWLDHQQPARLAADLNKVIKRVALEYFPREQISRTHGEPWLQFLDKTGDEPCFTDGAGRALEQWLYVPANRKPSGDLPFDASGLMGCCRRWLERQVR